MGLISCWLVVGLKLSVHVGRWFNSQPGHFDLFLAKTVYSILPQSTQLLVPSINKAVLSACALYAARIKMVSVCTVPAREGRSCQHYGGYKTIDRIPLPLVMIDVYVISVLR